MNRTKIEWARNPDGSPGYTLNPFSGCRNHTNGLCKGGGFPCYAYKLANGRLKPLYLKNKDLAGIDWTDGVPIVRGREKHDILINASRNDPFYPRFWEERLEEIWKLARERHTKVRGIFPCDMGDMFGIGIPEQWTRDILEAIKHAKPHRFYLLTKQYQELIKWSPFPENCFVGVTATGYKAFNNALDKLKCIEAKIKYISIEPLLEAIPFNMERLVYCGITWLIIGACTGTWHEMFTLTFRYPNLSLMPYTKRLYTAQPKIEWVREIVEAADKAGVKVFLKDNLEPLWTLENRTEPFFKFSRPSPGATETGRLRQELPDDKK